MSGEQQPLLMSEQASTPPPAPAQASAAPPIEDQDLPSFDEFVSHYIAQLVAILKPICLTMCLVVYFVRVTLPGRQETNSFDGVLVYSERDEDSDGDKLVGSLLNALIIVVFIGLMTFCLVCLYKYRCVKAIIAWLFLSMILLLALFGGLVLSSILSAYNLPMDVFTYSFMLWNFAIVGLLAVFWHSALYVHYAYLITVSALLAHNFSRLPEWTTWTLLIAIALYDILAVLTPCGPLKMLIEESQRQEEPIPALLYNVNGIISTLPVAGVTLNFSSFMGAGMGAGGADGEGGAAGGAKDGSDDEGASGKQQGVKLGLGDFVFYSVLISRASLFDWTTVFTCFVALLAGLALTLGALAVYRKALPALPFSIFFGAVFFFSTSFLMLPLIVELGQRQVFV